MPTRSQMIRQAASLPKGSTERRKILAELQEPWDEMSDLNDIPEAIYHKLAETVQDFQRQKLEAARYVLRDAEAQYKNAQEDLKWVGSSDFVLNNSPYSLHEAGLIDRQLYRKVEQAAKKQADRL